MGVQSFGSSPEFSKANLEKFLVLSLNKPDSQGLVVKAKKLLRKL